VNDVVLTAITHGFRDLLLARGELSSEKLVVRSMVPVSVRRPDQKGKLNNQVSAVFVDLPVGLPDPVDRLASIRGQMDEYKKTMQAVDAPSIIALGDYVAPTLLSMGVRAALQAGQMWCQAVTTNVPGPRFPLYVLGKRMVTATAYVPIAGGTRCSIGIFSYLNTMTFGINADFDGYPDVDVLSGGIRSGIEQLLALAAKKSGAAKDDVAKAAAAQAQTGSEAADAAAAKVDADKAAAETAKAHASAGTSPEATKATVAKATPAKATPAKATPAKRTPAKKTAATGTAAKKATATASAKKTTGTAKKAAPVKSTAGAAR
jgi:hypothetical protein